MLMYVYIYVYAYMCEHVHLYTYIHGLGNVYIGSYWILEATSGVRDHNIPLSLPWADPPSHDGDG